MAKKDITKLEFVKRPLINMGDEYKSLLRELIDSYRNAQIKAAVRVNTDMLQYYWHLGREISKAHAEAKWGSAFFPSLSLDMRAEFPGAKGLSETNLRYAHRWYLFYTQQNIIPQQVVEEIEMPTDFGLIPWGQHIYIFTHSKTIEEALFYIDKTIQESWSRVQLETAVDTKLYYAQGKAITNFKGTLPAPESGLAQAVLKSPYMLDFVDPSKILTERNLEDELATNITRFLLELGKGFAYVGRQMELKMPNGQSYFPDMVFYHTKLHSYLALEIKRAEFKSEYVGKLNFYVSALDELMKGPDDNPSIGLLICTSKDDTLVEWSLRGIQRPLGVAEYKLREYLPSEEQLQNLIKGIEE